ncbi:DUF4433 domain-containing protein, partial [Mycobacterium sp. KBS0706]|uniref:DarT ssDNA thymidine ADP-ribosyltransferase family protein n=1 Tax=Mycobacterium sp. KBS0706 TaxID=2578109 RepID=UPI00117C3C95
RKEQRVSDTVFLRINPCVIKATGVLVTSEVSNKSGAIREPPSTMLDKIDLDVIYTRTDWKNSEVKARLNSAKLYEILVPKIVPINMILNIPNG